ncbi:MAG TPA: radical SAM protein [Caldisericia bacterium]|nr:radical SAM protein [Caldisericia bacterium]HQG59402.1 radical SAM protein [Caldisericia bacterium]HQH48366.1 radical SAM protein [Caldisericia bacterium]HQJ44347.1 radical SAM protein [Caldisericia bacterium]
MNGKIEFFLPGMFTVDGETGIYPAVSITGKTCILMCNHCMAHILCTMPDCSTPEKLVEFALKANSSGARGILVSGGSDKNGKLPWETFWPALLEIKQKTKLILSVHSGFVDEDQARLLKQAKVDQALIDVIGSDDVARRIYKLPNGIAARAVDAVFQSGLHVVPHVLVGLDYGKPSDEEKALEMIARYSPKTVVIIALRPSRHTPMGEANPPTPERVAEIIGLAKSLMPRTFINLGCARPVGEHKRQTDILAIRAGVDGIAVPSKQAEEEAARLGLTIIKHPTCCSLISLGSM